MDYRALGTSGLTVSPLCLGTMMFGGPTEERTAARIIDKARAVGINFIDTADVYNAGASEQITGRAIAADRERWVLATKVGNAMGEGPNQRGLGRKWVMEALNRSLERLGTDYVDIYYLHREDLSTPLEETVSAIGDLIAAGKIRYFGVSNFRAWRIAEIVRLCERLAIDRPVVSQPYYNAMNRMPEVEQLPVCRHYGIGVVPYSPLARGVLTGKYATAAAPGKDTRAGRADHRMMETEWRPESLEIAARVAAYAAERGTTPVALAVNWVLQNAIVTATIAGPRTERQWDDYLAALEYRFGAEDEAFFDGLVAPGHPSTPGYNDPAYPLEGRPTRFDPSPE